MRPIISPRAIAGTHASPVDARHPMARLPASTASVPPMKPPSTDLPPSQSAGVPSRHSVGRCSSTCRPLLPTAAPAIAQATSSQRSVARAGRGSVRATAQ